MVVVNVDSYPYQLIKVSLIESTQAKYSTMR